MLSKRQTQTFVTQFVIFVLKIVIILSTKYKYENLPEFFSSSFLWVNNFAFDGDNFRRNGLPLRGSVASKIDNY